MYRAVVKNEHQMWTVSIKSLESKEHSPLTGFVVITFVSIPSDVMDALTLTLFPLVRNLWYVEVVPRSA